MNSRSKASMKYNKENTVQLIIRLNKKTDEDLINWLKHVNNRQGYIKSLIREDLDELLNDDY